MQQKSKYRLYTYLVILLACITSCKSFLNKNTANKNFNLTIIYTGSAYGEIKPCGCSEQGDLGGLSRRATYIKNLRNDNKNVILLDAGDNFEGGGRQSIIKSKAMIAGMEKIGYDAYTIGEKDFIYGNKFLYESLPKKYLSSNALFLDNKDFFKPFTIKEINGSVKVLIIGAQDKNLFYSGSETKLEIKDISKSIKNSIINAKENFDLVIVLTHSGLETAMGLLNIKGVDVVVNGHIEGISKVNETFLAGNGIVVHPRECGQHMGRLDVSINNGIKTYSNAYIALTKEFKDDKDLSKLYADYNKKIEDLFFENIKLKKNTKKLYATDVECKKCHEKEHNIWVESKHSNAYKTLRNINKNHDPECLQCHTLGFGVAGGFIDENITKDLKNVQCEICHGPGLNHIKLTSDDYGSGAKDVCGICHNKIHSPEFDFKTYWKKIAH